ncbi:hypothetical protein HOD20_08955 [archaeon]|jgi:archaea-specific RecJ-like exonuclease|nr:hypothetical protein [archaeon]MBT4647234.1 hypothetical protein [archaeon]MBT6821029.1 hypothetical protein [archaeon]MBT7391458.1 hypothetical protein [archaeon]
MEFTIKSEKFEKLKPKFIEISNYIKDWINDRKPVLIKHHNDCDGHSAGIAMEMAILPLIKKNGGYTNKSYKRAVSRTPFYDYSDALRDVDSFAYFSQSPLVIVLDHGSTKESILSLNKLKENGAKIIIIDHHNPSKKEEGSNEVEDYVDLFLNPHTSGFGSEIVTGMLCTELARFINSNIEIPKQIPALSGTADKSNCDEYDIYLKNSGFDKAYLEKWAMCIDFESFYVRNYNSNAVRDMFEENERTKNSIEMISKVVENRFKMLLPTLHKYSETTNINGINYSEIHLFKFSQRSYFPTTSKVTSYFHKKIEGPKITLGILDDSISFRLGDVKYLTLHLLISYLKEKLPYAQIDGGGHIFAGTIRFAKGAKEDVLEESKKFIKDKNYIK